MKKHIRRQFVARQVRHAWKQAFLILGVVLCHLFTVVNPVRAQGTAAFTYQGRLVFGGVPANGVYDFEFILFNDPTNVGGAGVGNFAVAPATIVSNGLFTVSINTNNEFGPSAFNGAARWLEIGVRTNGGGPGYTFLSPRQLVTPSPYAEFAGAANNALVASSVSAGGVNSNSIANSTIITANLADNAIITAKIADGSVTTPKLADHAVTTAKLADGAVTGQQLGLGAAIANLAASGQTAVPSGGIIMSASDANTKKLMTAGYVKVGTANLVQENWQTSLAVGPPSTGSLTAPRAQHTAVWTGSEMIEWGGTDGITHNNGARYNPVNNTWTVMSVNNAPAPRSSHVAVWTGSQMVVWGGMNDSYDGLGDGGRYNPSTDTWTGMSTLNAPAGRISPTVVWTGSRMVVWGGFNYYDYGSDYEPVGVPTGGRYDPVANTWASVSTNNAPPYCMGHSAVWSGTEMLVYGGDEYYFSGGKYNPTTDTWASMNTNTPYSPGGRIYHSAVWTGTQMIVWGGYTVTTDYMATNNGARYNPSANTWTAMTSVGAPSSRYLHTAVWTGSKMLVWGGYNYYYGDIDYGDGGIYDPSANSWTVMPTNNAPSARDSHTAIWTGTNMIIWGGEDTYSGYYSFSYTYPEPGAFFNPGFGIWSTMANAPGSGEPAPRQSASSVWTGAEMLIWGGENSGYYLRTGGRYNPTLNAWHAITTQGAPSGRVSHSAVWTGSNMIVWGGVDQIGPYGNGARYNPVADTWSSVSTSNAPVARLGHSAVWDGTEMLIWGGGSGYGLVQPPPVGGRYNPITDSWKSMSTTNQPSPCANTPAIWTGQEMLVWGGFNPVFTGNYYSTGGRYNPTTDSWIQISTNNAPSARGSHTAVWTGTDYIMFGGTNGVTNLNTGGRYTLATDTWTPTSVSNAPSPRSLHSAVWSGDRMIVYGGYVQGNGQSFYLSSGGLYDPVGDTWYYMSSNAQVPGLANFCAAWTGQAMLIWGGLGTGGYSQSPYLYTPGRTMDLLLRP